MKKLKKSKKKLKKYQKEMKFSNVFTRNLDAYMKKYRYIINEGGTRSGKTYSILQVLFFILLKSKKKQIISVVSQTMPHLKKGVIRDFEEIVNSAGIDFYKNYNKTEHVFDINGNIIEFFSVDNIGKVHGSKRTILFVNECNFISYDVFFQLNLRTTDTVFLDYNPITHFWVHSELLPNEKTCLIKSTYKDNIENLSTEQIMVIEEMQKYSNWWRIYGEGQIGFDENSVFPIDKIRFFDDNEIDFSKFIYNVCYVDTADKGGDYFCAVFGGVIGFDVYIYDVIFNNNLTLSKNETILIEKLKINNVDICIVETNKEGSYFAANIRKNTNTKIYGIFSSQNKETRILLQADFVLDHCIFKKNQNTAYRQFVEQLSHYSLNSKNIHDDAPDAIAGLSKYIKQLIQKN